MIAEERRNAILSILLKKSDTTVEDLAERFNKSIPTIYKDIKILEKQKSLQKIYGGVKVIIAEGGFFDFYHRVNQKEEIKTALAKEAVKLIENNDVIAIDASTTSYYLAKEIKKENEKNITIITNSATVIKDDDLIKKDNVNIFLIGGFLEKKIASFLEADPKKIIPDLLIKKFFYSSFGFSAVYGVMDSFMPQNCAIKKSFFEMSIESIGLISSDKFRLSGVYNWASVDKIKKIITDELIDEETLNLLHDKKIEVIIAKI